jgi:hypothetical protein
MLSQFKDGRRAIVDLTARGRGEMNWWTIGLLTGGAWLAARFGAGYPPTPPSVRLLRPREYATIAAAASATFPRGGAVPLSGLDANVAGHVDRFVQAQPRGSRRLMRLLFVLVEHATMLFPPGGPGARRRFSALTPVQQVAYLEGWRTSRLFFRRLVFTSLRAIVTMGYLSHADVLAALDLVPQQIEGRPTQADGLWPPIGERSSLPRSLAS